MPLIQSQKICHFTVVLYGSEFWQGLLDWLDNRIRALACIDDQDLQLFHLVDKPEYVPPIIQSHFAKLDAHPEDDQRWPV